MDAAPRAIIVGGGPIGLACAALLARRRIDCRVLDARPLDEARRDGRLLALSRGSWEILGPLLGSDLPPRAAIGDVFVSSSGDFGATHIGAADFDGADLGATVRYGDLLAALAARVAMLPGVSVHRPVAASDVRQRHDRVEVLLADGSTMTGDVAIHAEGNVPAGVTSSTAVDDWALLTEVRLQPAREGLPAAAAFERFTRSGPLALLPVPGSSGGGAQRTLALIWCMRQSEAQRRAELGDAALLAELQAQIGPRIGAVKSIGPRRAVALPRRRREQVSGHRVVAIGNAAQTLHPVAGQGFNLGLRDCVTLSDELAQSAPAPEALARYSRRRRFDRDAIALLTRGMPAIFAARFAPVALARGLGLALLDTAPALRRQLAHLLIFGVRS